jgi:adenosylcobinamide kinase/adenosylcobinamide-phosphate guanylyltransferase
VSDEIRADESQVILVTGPARSGKSEWAEMLAMQTERSVIYIATANVDPNDPEWQARIEQHRRRRPPAWQTLSVPLELSQAIGDNAHPSHCLLVDSLGTWVANWLDRDFPAWESAVREFFESLTRADGTVVLVAEETGWGVVPAYPSGRQFRDRLGTLVRQLGGIAHPVYLVTGGHALNLSILGTPLPKSSQSLP